jgi:hypothetical protein
MGWVLTGGVDGGGASGAGDCGGGSSGVGDGGDRSCTTYSKREL